MVDLDRDFVILFGFNCLFGVKNLVFFVIKIKELIIKFVLLYVNVGLFN